jgi:hypothetical protein
MIGKNYEYKVDQHICYIWDKSGNFLGSVTIDKTNAWTPHNEEGVMYIPINSALHLLGYEAAKDCAIE